MKIERSDQLRLLSNQCLVILAGRLNVIEECTSLDFNNPAYQVRHLFNVIILFYFIIDSLLHALLAIFHFPFARILRYDPVQFVWV